MKKPELVLITPQGGTVHKYPLTGGKTTFEPVSYTHLRAHET